MSYRVPTPDLLEKPCIRCGAVDRYPTGTCRPCARRIAREQYERIKAERAHTTGPCAVCGSTKRQNGNCIPCARKRDAERRARLKEAPCEKCGAFDWTPRGYCRKCAKRKNDARTPPTGPCRSCGVDDRNGRGECRPCKRLADRRAAKRNPLRVRAKAARRRRWARKSETHYSATDVKGRYSLQQGRCWWCREPVGDDFHVDHVIPLSRGGSNGPENICISCPSCNYNKGNQLPTEYAGRLF